MKRICLSLSDGVVSLQRALLVDALGPKPLGWISPLISSRWVSSWRGGEGELSSSLLWLSSSWYCINSAGQLSNERFLQLPHHSYSHAQGIWDKLYFSCEAVLYGKISISVSQEFLLGLGTRLSLYDVFEVFLINPNFLRSSVLNGSAICEATLMYYVHY